ncbi:MAG TPA: response regulator transcription factor [Trueperaceae bacterium]|jgi:two-component system response regulator AdeR
MVPPRSATVLIVEDEPGISRTLDAYLKREGYATEIAADGHRALSLYRAARPDIVLLDVMLPGMDGFEVLSRIRGDGSTPVILLTARGEEVDRLVGLELGADDYVVKPFSFREVVARVKAVLRRANGQADPPPAFVVGRLRVEPEHGRAQYGGKDLALTATEFRLLAALAASPGRLFSRADLIERALPESAILERTLDSHLKNLRRKLAEAGANGLIVTVRGMGFRLDERAAEGAR